MDVTRAPAAVILISQQAVNDFSFIMQFILHTICFSSPSINSNGLVKFTKVLNILRIPIICFFFSAPIICTSLKKVFTVDITVYI